MKSSLYLVLFLAVPSLFGSFAWSQPATGTAFTQASTSLGNFHSFGSGLYRGARPSNLEAIKKLKSIGVRTVIDLQGGDINDGTFGIIAGVMEPGETQEWLQFERESVTNLGMNFINLPLNSLAPIDQYETGKAIGKILELINDPNNQPVYVHCEHGKDRTGLIVALYRVFYQSWPKEKAHEEMLALGHSTFFTPDMDRFFYAATEDKP